MPYTTAAGSGHGDPNRRRFSFGGTSVDEMVITVAQVGPGGLLFQKRLRLVRGTIVRGGATLGACVCLPDADDATLAETARPLLAAEFAAGRWFDTAENDWLIRIGSHGYPKGLAKGGGRWVAENPREPILVAEGMS